MALNEAVQTLKQKFNTIEERLAAYSTLQSHLVCDITGSGDSTALNGDLKEHGAELLMAVCKDLHSSNEKIVVSALQMMVSCVKEEQIESVVSAAESQYALEALFCCASKAWSTEVVNLVLECLAVQRFHPDALVTKISALITCVEEMNALHTSTSGVDIIVDIFVRLDEQIHEDLGPLAPRWAKLVLTGLASLNVAVRENCFSLLEKFKDVLKEATDFSKHVIKAINAGFTEAMTKVMPGNEAYMMKAWAFVVDVVGKELHRGSSINTMLVVIEISFKGSSQARLNAFIAWRSLIDNFALDKNVISDPKRIKLLMMVLKIDNAKTEDVAVEKMKTWWHFAQAMGAKLMMNFEQIVYPLLHFCVGNGKLHAVLEQGQSPRLALKASASNSPASLFPSSRRPHSQQLPVFPVLHKLGLQALAHILSKSDFPAETGNISWTLTPLSVEVVKGSAFFIKHAPILLGAFQELLKSNETQLEEALILKIWAILGNYLQAAMDTSLKAECRDVYSNFLGILHTLVQSQALPGQTVFKMVETCGNFPSKVLASTAYSIIGGQTLRGCPALLLCEILLTKHVVEGACVNEDFVTLFSTLVNAGAVNMQGALKFIETVTDLLDTQALCLSEWLWKMWDVTAQVLQDTINETNEVNQGDALEHNFGCLYSVLLLPVKHQMPSQVSTNMCKTVVKAWKDLYHSFARLAALVATAEANACLEETCAKMIHTWRPEFKDASHLEFLASVCQKMLECTDFSALSSQQTSGGVLTLSPTKWVRRRQKPMGNLHSFVHLLAAVQNGMNDHLTKAEESGPEQLFQKQDSASVSLSFIGHTLVEVYTKLFSHITTDAVITNCLAVLAGPLSQLYHNYNKTGPFKLFSQAFLQKLETLWQEIGHCVSGRYNGQYDSEFLEHVSPLLEKTFVHSRRAIKTQTVTLWNTTFSRSATLKYPKSLRPILFAMKEKNAINLPGWITSDEVAVIEETPFTEMSMGESQGPAPVLPGMASPKRQRGSLINRDVSPLGKLSPRPKVSPAKVVTPKEVRNLFSGASKRIAVDFMPKDDFVVIESPATKKKRILTEHQKEVLKEKCVIPAMYNNLDASRDVSLMAHFGTETQQSMSCADVIVVNSSESQDSANTRQPSTRATRNSSGERKNTIHESSATPQPQPSTPKRRSVRIQEVKNNDRVEDIVSNEDTKSKDGVNKPKDKTPPKQEHENEEGLSETVQDDGCQDEKQFDTKEDVVKSSVKDLSQSSTDVSAKESEGGKNVDMDAPFVMFRNKSSHSDEHMLSSSQEAGPATTKSSFKGVSLRKIRSQDDFPHVRTRQSCSEQTSTPEKAKIPRRVPLKKLNEQEKGVDQEAANSALVTRNKSRTSSPSGVLDKWLTKSEPDKSRSGNAKQMTCTPSTSPDTMETGPISNTSCTLVEDTQSPGKLAQVSTASVNTSEASKSIAETPEKVDQAHSTPGKVHSARKLFADGDSASSVNGSLSEQSTKCNTSKSQIDTNNSQQEENSGFSSSQGFETTWNEMAKQAEHTMFGFSQLQSQQNSEAEENKISHVTESHSINKTDEIPESENLFPNTEDNCISPFDMPTLASPSKMLQNFLQPSSKSTSSSGSSKTSSSSGEEQANGSTESDFYPSQPTLNEETCSSVPNKRKRGTPKKFSPTRCKRRTRGNAGNNKKCSCCRSPVAKSKRKNGLATRHTVSQESKGEKSDSSSSLTTTPSVDKTSSPQSSNKEKQLTSKDPFVPLNRIDKTPPEIGEVTPDVKSPSTVTPRRHRAVKRRGRPPLNESAKKRCKTALSIHDKTSDLDNLSDFSQNSTGKEDKISIKNKHTSPSVSPVDKRKRSLSASRSRHMLRTRSRGSPSTSPKEHLQPPKKVRRLRDRRVEENKEENKSAPEEQLPSSIGTAEKILDELSIGAAEKIADLPDKPEDDEVVPETLQETENTSPSQVLQETENTSPSQVLQETENTSPSQVLQETENTSPSQVNEGEVSIESEPPQKENAVAAVKGFQRSDYVDLTDDNSNDCQMNSERNWRIVDAALNTALSEIVSASLAAKKELNEESFLGRENHSSTDTSGSKVSLQESSSGESRSAHVNIEESQDHLQPGQTVVVDDCEENEETQGSECSADADKDTGRKSSSQEKIVDNSAVQSSDRENDEPCSGPVSNSITTEADGEVHEAGESVELAAEVKETEDVDEMSTENMNAEEQDEASARDSCPHQSGDHTQENVQPVAKHTSEPERIVNDNSKHHEKDSELVEGEENQSSDVAKSADNDESIPVEASTNQQVIPALHSESQQKELNMGKQESSEKTSEGLSATRNQSDPAASDPSQNRSPSVSILKRPAQETPPSAKNRRVSFAEPVVSGESPVREHYDDDLPTSSLNSPRRSSPGRKASQFTRVRSLGRVSGYRRRLDASPRKESSLSRVAKSGISPSPSPQSQSPYKPTQESQLDSTRPIFPDLVDCTKPLDDILPQLTSSLWFRGLCQLMKGRNLNTIGDLCALTEVEVNRLPIRHPKVQTVRDTLKTYMTQHGLTKSSATVSNCTKSPQSKGATTSQEVTPSSIDDEGVKVGPNADKELQLSPIKDPEAPVQTSSVKESTEYSQSLHSMTLSQLVDLSKTSGFKDVDTAELLNTLQTLNTMSGCVLEEIKSRQQSN